MEIRCMAMIHGLVAQIASEIRDVYDENWSPCHLKICIFKNRVRK